MRKPISDRQKLRDLFPTMTDYEKAVKDHENNKALAKTLSVHVSTLHLHLGWLKSGKKRIGTNADRKKTDPKISKAAMESIVSENGSRNEVKVFMMTHDYQPGQTGYEGLEFVGIKKGITWFEAVEKVNAKRRNAFADW